MLLPEFKNFGDLPEGIHKASFVEVVDCFGQGTPQRQLVTERLKHIYSLSRATGKLECFVIFGSYITAKPDPQDVYIILVMSDDFAERDVDADVFPVFDHLQAQEKPGASLFVIRSAFILGETVDEFLAQWQIKRDLSKRGIIELILEDSQ
jgi:hypothetical protein